MIAWIVYIIFIIMAWSSGFLAGFDIGRSKSDEQKPETDFLSIYRDSPPDNCLTCWFCYPDFRPERESSHYCDRVKMPVQVTDGIPEWCPLRKERDKNGTKEDS